MWHEYLRLEIAAMFRPLQGRFDENFEVYFHRKIQAKREYARDWYWMHSREPKYIEIWRAKNAFKNAKRRADPAKWARHCDDSKQRWREKRDKHVERDWTPTRVCPCCGTRYWLDPHSNGNGRKKYCSTKCRNKVSNDRAYAKIKERNEAAKRARERSLET